MNDFFFQYPSLLYLEFLLIPMAALYVWRQLRKKRPYVVMSTLRLLCPGRGPGRPECCVICPLCSG